MPITKEQETVFNQIKEKKFDDTHLLEELSNMSSTIIKEHINNSVDVKSFKNNYDVQCPMCIDLFNHPAKTLRYEIEIYYKPPYFAWPNKKQDYFVFIGSFMNFKCIVNGCDWHKDDLIFHGYCAFSMVYLEHPFYKSFPRLIHRDFYLISKTLEEVREIINKKFHKQPI